MKPASDIINIPVGYFALPVPRTGSIEPRSGYDRSTSDGQEIHQRVQRKRAQDDPTYQAEVPVGRLLERGGFRFQVNGRMDGVYGRENTCIEEIKSCFNLWDLKRRLTGGSLQEPYCLQLCTYGYFHWLEHGVVPRLTFHLVSSRNGQSADLEITLDLEEYQGWLDARLDELVREAARAAKRAQRRRKAAATFPFPFEKPRPGQVELMQEIELGMALGRRMLIQAPTGLGKTVGVLHPVLREALGRGQAVCYVTPKNSQHEVAEDAVHRFREAGSKLRSLTITAKSKICFQNEPICTPDYCEYARDYYAKVARHGLVELLEKKRSLKSRNFRQMGEEYQVCPFELQIDSARLADVVICDYNYVFAPRSALGRAAGLPVDQVGKPNLVIDEAHNLPPRAMEYYSPRLSSAVLEGMREDLAGVPPSFRREAAELLEECVAAVLSCRRGDGGKASRIEPPLAPFLELDGRLRALLSRYLEADVEIRQEDPVLRLCYYWSQFTETLEFAVRSERQEFFTSYQPHGGGGSVKVTCCDASELIRERYAEYQQVVGFSATLKPMEYYAKLSGLDPEEVRWSEFQSPFPPERRKLLIIPQVSTRYSQRERNYARIADALARIVALRRGNYLAFFPSFGFLERVAELFRAPEGFEVLRQERSMKGARTAEFLEQLRSGVVPTVVFAVQGGSLSEGVDYAGDMVIGAFVVGPPLPNYDLEREEMRAYYQRHYGKGFEYAYTIPAMSKAIQSAGRVIRSETDRGVIVLMDDRFLELGYSSAMPADWFETRAEELVSGAILKDVGDFWARPLDPEQ
ncbi:ATP-dependent DNA helicase [Geomonas nitrogeniifigens]|uniref:ATP-dependent DNA helicase n=1 Tax=Geomonas diazotrophica TaxID=2843197 RepID=UPI001C2C6CC0|nr:ATP-dependent DNA helicase [Geomonas nitrogeniifigens]QXE86512.1 ATP-dependent DNA helicase [Geomonas nitrogeniifigens]